MIVDGKVIAQSILEEVTQLVAARQRVPHLRVFTCAPNFETKKFLSLKQKRAAEAGITVTVTEFPEDFSPVDMVATIIGAHNESDGIVVQLPFPPHIAIAPQLSAVAKTHDVDALSYHGEETTVLPPVVGAIDAIATAHNITWTGKKVAVVGSGRLVGAPAALYAKQKGGIVTVVSKDTENATAHIRTADILILGAGVPGLVSAPDVAPGVVIFDAGTSEEGGMLVGDAAPDVATVAKLLTPVPGGIGPITIAILLRNLVRLTSTS